jgi:RNA polymerase sigma factor (sigma-70 family)
VKEIPGLSRTTTYIPDESPALVRAAANGSQSAFECLLQQWDEYLSISGRRYSRNTTVDRDDLYQIGSLALWRAVKNFRSSRGAFGHYASSAIKNSMLREVARSVRSGATIALEDVDSQQIEEALHRNSSTSSAEPDLGVLLKSVLSWVRSLDRQLSDIYDLLYQKEIDQRAAASKLGVTQPRVSQLKARLVRLGAKSFR